MQVLRHSEHTLKTALLSKNLVLVLQYEKLDAGEQRLMNEAFQPCNNLFEPITVHSQSDWISSHPKAPQDIEQFFSDCYRKAPCTKKHIIYIQSIGSLGKTRVISEEYIKWLKGYCEAFFYGLKVKFLEPVSVSETKCSFRVNEHTQNLQIHTGHMHLKQEASCLWSFGEVTMSWGWFTVLIKKLSGSWLVSCTMRKY
uniref:Uncharacterized protein n=1 Tax=Mus spicilegus TaxID=10103 RepID=A0A8C6H287_MUSSI